MPATITLTGIEGLPEIRPGDDLARMVIAAASLQETPLVPRDILVITQKIVSKAEGRLIRLVDINPSALAIQFATAWDKDARVVEVALMEAKRVVRMDHGVLITETHHGFRCANSGVDASNVGAEHEEVVALLPTDPDASARKIRDEIRAQSNLDLAVIISDTFGRPWREGAENVAVGVAGIEALWDYVGQLDSHGRELRSTSIAVADELAAAAELVTNKLARVPAAIIRGYSYIPGESGVKPLIRHSDTDLFR